MSTPPAIDAVRLVRLGAPLRGCYCAFEKGESVKISRGHLGTWRVEREVWRNAATICNVLVGVPDHVLICDGLNLSAL